MTRRSSMKLTAEFMILPPHMAAVAAIAKARGHKRGLYADIPGTGPKGESCGTCQHLQRVVFARAYLKCGLCRQWWTGGGASDVKARAPACSKWERKQP